MSDNENTTLVFVLDENLLFLLSIEISLLLDK
jgi:hypothetical protein